MTTYLVLVPKPGSSAGMMIDAGSGVVCDPLNVISGALMADERIEVYYEGNRYGSDGMKRFEDKLFHAAGRLHQRYPTIARGVWPKASFDVVGTYSFSDDWRERSLAITDPQKLHQWCGGL